MFNFDYVMAALHDSEALHLLEDAGSPRCLFLFGEQAAQTATARALDHLHQADALRRVSA